jgi:uncharacterized membrane-anchored protein YhcB (DUF1043 family)
MSVSSELKHETFKTADEVQEEIEKKVTVTVNETLDHINRLEEKLKKLFVEYRELQRLYTEKHNPILLTEKDLSKNFKSIYY